MEYINPYLERQAWAVRFLAHTLRTNVTVHARESIAGMC